jgi:hypothetical protein
VGHGSLTGKRPAAGRQATRSGLPASQDEKNAGAEDKNLSGDADLPVVARVCLASEFHGHDGQDQASVAPSRPGVHDRLDRLPCETMPDTAPHTGDNPRHYSSHHPWRGAPNLAPTIRLTFIRAHGKVVFSYIQPTRAVKKEGYVLPIPWGLCFKKDHRAEYAIG